MFCWCKSIIFAGVNQLPMTWSHFSLEEDHYNNHFKLVKIDSFPVAADITNRGSLSQIWQTFFITNWDNYHYKSGPLL